MIVQQERKATRFNKPVLSLTSSIKPPSWLAVAVLPAELAKKIRNTTATPTFSEKELSTEITKIVLRTPGIDAPELRKAVVILMGDDAKTWVDLGAEARAKKAISKAKIRVVKSLENGGMVLRYYPK